MQESSFQWAGVQEWWGLSTSRAGHGCPQPGSVAGQGAAGPGLLHKAGLSFALAVAEPMNSHF